LLPQIPSITTILPQPAAKVKRKNVFFLKKFFYYSMS
jgi:hypothetical protein